MMTSGSVKGGVTAGGEDCPSSFQGRQGTVPPRPLPSHYLGVKAARGGSLGLGSPGVSVSSTAFPGSYFPHLQIDW